METLYKEAYQKMQSEHFEHHNIIIKMISELALKMVDRKEYESLIELNKIMLAI